MRNTEGFVQADSRNLPRVETIMMMEFLQQSDKYNLAGIRGAKASLSSRTSYVANAVGYVELKRLNDVCMLKCRITPEHRVRNKMYVVSAEVNEIDETVIDVTCHDCAASEGGCKHALCFLMWLVKKTEEPSTTSTTCYWKKPALSAAVTQDKIIKSSSIGRRNEVHCHSDVPSLKHFLDEAKKHEMNECMIMQYNIKEINVHGYSIYNMMLNFVLEQNSINGPLDFQHFRTYANSQITDDVKALVESKTKDQVNCKLWHSMRQSRVTASKLHEATKCVTGDGALVQTIMGGYKVPETAAIKRGKKLEAEVIKVIEEDLGVTIEKSGLFLVSPLIGASPDGICDTFVVEVKCPFTEKTMKNYMSKNGMSKKCQAQIQLQMSATKKNKGLLCIADPTFEQTKKIHKHWVQYNDTYVNKLIEDAEIFWEKFIFHKVLECVK